MNKDFVSLQADDTLEMVLKTFVKNNITSAPVFDDDEFIGIISDVEIVRYFIPKKFLLLWQRRGPTPVTELKKFIAGKAVKKPRLKLSSEQELFPVLKKIVQEVKCIPVFENKKLVGLVRSEDMSKYFLKEIAKDSVDKSLTEGASCDCNTVVDKFLIEINNKEKVSAIELSKKLGLPIKTIEKLGESLARHNLIGVKYSFIKGAEFRRLKNEKK